MQHVISFLYIIYCWLKYRRKTRYVSRYDSGSVCHSGEQGSKSCSGRLPGVDTLRWALRGIRLASNNEADMDVIRLLDTFPSNRSFSYTYSSPRLIEAPQTQGDMTTADYYVWNSCQMVEAAVSEGPSNSKVYIVVDALITEVSVSGTSKEEEIHLMEAGPVPFENFEEDQAEGEEVWIIDFDKNVFNDVEVILVAQQISRILHRLQTMNAVYSRGFRTSIHTLRFDYIRGLVLISPGDRVLRKGEDITEIFDGIVHGYRILRQTQNHS